VSRQGMHHGNERSGGGALDQPGIGTLEKTHF
jgi:hypothetical protein